MDHGHGFQAIKQFITEIEQFVTKKSTEFDAEHLGGPQGFVLLYLTKCPDADLSFKDIERHLRISKSVTSNLIKRMEKNGFVSIEPSQTDKRIKYVRLTDFGRSKADKLKQFVDYLHAVFLKDISREDAEITRRVMQTLSHNIHQEMKKGDKNV